MGQNFGIKIPIYNLLTQKNLQKTVVDVPAMGTQHFFAITHADNWKSLNS